MSVSKPVRRYGWTGAPSPSPDPSPASYGAAYALLDVVPGDTVKIKATGLTGPVVDPEQYQDPDDPVTPDILVYCDFGTSLYRGGYHPFRLVKV